MNFLHYDLNYLDSQDVVKVTLDKQANVRLMDDSNFNNYKRSQKYIYYSGYAKVSPLTLKPPSSGRWHVVIDLGGYTGSVRAAVSTIRQ